MRSINIVGSILFIFYGQFMRAYSTVITNIIATAVNVYYIIREVIWHKNNK